MPRRAVPKKGAAYQLKITLRDIKPPVWRRLALPDCRLDHLQVYLQIAMGWGFAHLWAFELPEDRRVMPPDPDGFLDDPDEEHPVTLTLSMLWSQGIKRFRFLYDFGDGWTHDVVLQDELKLTTRMKPHLCVDGARACPPDDCGGAPGYEDILKALAAPKKSAEQKELLEWVGPDYDPERFSASEVTADLLKITAADLRDLSRMD